MTVTRRNRHHYARFVLGSRARLTTPVAREVKIANTLNALTVFVLTHLKTRAVAVVADWRVRCQAMLSLGARSESPVTGHPQFCAETCRVEQVSARRRRFPCACHAIAGPHQAAEIRGTGRIQPEVKGDVAGPFPVRRARPSGPRLLGTPEGPQPAGPSRHRSSKTDVARGGITRPWPRTPTPQATSVIEDTASHRRRHARDGAPVGRSRGERSYLPTWRCKGICS